MKLLGVDIGGTFTDFVLLNAEIGTIETTKLLTDPVKPDEVVMAGIKQLLTGVNCLTSELAYIVHGTTLVTNAVIERSGNPTYLLTTKGFRDVLEIRREKRYDIYNLDIRIQPPLIERRRRLEVDERTLADGLISVEPRFEDVETLIRNIPLSPLPTFAISFLHAYKNAANEQRVAGWIRDILGPDVAISMSSEVAPEIREYERTSTTSINAYVQPLVANYLDRLEVAVEAIGVKSAPMIMLSHGGLARFPFAKRFPVRILESGPAGGAMIAAHLARSLRIDHALAFDMGGTTAKICMIDNYIPRIVADAEVARLDRFKKGSGLPVMVPMVDLIEIGAGGGSIASLDSMSLLAVGPRSAGATPGPACYGRGGTLPTISDSSLLLGYLDDENFLGGKMRLHKELAKQAFGGMARMLNKTETEVAWAVHAAVNQNMVRAAQMHAFDCACDLNDYTMICFGGAAPAHACRVAKELGIKRVVVPIGAGVASALGFLVAPGSMDLRRSALMPLAAAPLKDLQATYDAMIDEAIAALSDIGLTRETSMVSLAFEARFVGQGHALVVDLGADVGGLNNEALCEKFRQRYAAAYGGQPVRSEIELTALLVRVSGAPLLGEGTIVNHEAGALPLQSDSRDAYFPEYRGMASARLTSRRQLQTEAGVDGPAIIQERETTIVVPPGARATTDGNGNIIIDVTVMEPV
jgi:N-methylhydantoinase A/oxoprolinase/acetone carboxylase beta subunit